MAGVWSFLTVADMGSELCRVLLLRLLGVPAGLRGVRHLETCNLACRLGLRLETEGGLLRARLRFLVGISLGELFQSAQMVFLFDGNDLFKVQRESILQQIQSHISFATFGKANRQQQLHLFSIS